jgi:hypothetical protein
VSRFLFKEIEVVSVAKEAPGQPRDERGRYGSTGGSSGASSPAAQSVASYVASTPRAGFTFDTAKGARVTTGYAVADKDGSKILDPSEAGPKAIGDFMRANSGRIVGGWHDPDSGKIFLDRVTVLADRKEAEELGRKNDQIAIADLDAIERGEDGEIRIGGSGGL